ncbi:MAG: DUF4139 domain-containing protein [Aliishimia sp.]
MMRTLICALTCFPLSAWADIIDVPSKATSAIVYSAGATVTHSVSVTMPAGAHQLVFSDLPSNVYLDALRVKAPDLKIGALRYRTDLTPPQPDRDTPEIIAAKAEIERIEDNIQSVEDTAARQKLAVAASEARIEFLTALGGSDTLPADTTALRDLGQMIGVETLAAREAAFDAGLAVRGTLKQLKDLKKALKDAEQALAALVPETQNRPLLVMDVIAGSAVSDTTVDVSFYSDVATWRPTYDLRLSDTDTPQLVIERGAQVLQESGENWEGISLTLSTREPIDETDPWPLRPDLRRILDESKYAVTSRAAPAARTQKLADGLVIEAPVIVEEASSMAMNFQGLSVSYTYSDAVDVASGADFVRLPFDSLTLDAELIARAVPLNHDTAFLVAKVTNTTNEPLLTSDAVLRFFDGVLVGASGLEAIEVGQEAEIGFGPIEGIQLTRRVLKRDSGDRGIISRSNEQTEEIEITAKNLTDRTWQVELRDRVPYSEQEDLEITFRTSPEPDVTGVEDRRGILQWNLEMTPGNEATISTSHRITWPEGQTLR